MNGQTTRLLIRQVNLARQISHILSLVGYNLVWLDITPLSTMECNRVRRRRRTSVLEELVSEVLVGGVMLEIGAYVLEGEHDQEVATQISTLP